MIRIIVSVLLFALAAYPAHADRTRDMGVGENTCGEYLMFYGTNRDEIEGVVSQWSMGYMTGLGRGGVFFADLSQVLPRHVLDHVYEFCSVNQELTVRAAVHNFYLRLPIRAELE